MRSLKKAALLCVLLMCAQQVRAQVPFGGCAEFPVTPDGGHCWTWLMAIVRFGHGWTATTDSANVGAEKPGMIQFFWVIAPTPAAQAAGVWSLTAFARDNLSPQGFVTLAGDRLLEPGESNELVLVAPLLGCNEHGQECLSIPDPVAVATGVLTVGYVADSPEALRGLQLPAVKEANRLAPPVRNIRPPGRISPAPVPAPARPQAAPWSLAISPRRGAGKKISTSFNLLRDCCSARDLRTFCHFGFRLPASSKWSKGIGWSAEKERGHPLFILHPSFLRL